MKSPNETIAARMEAEGLPYELSTAAHTGSVVAQQFSGTVPVIAYTNETCNWRVFCGHIAAEEAREVAKAAKSKRGVYKVIVVTAAEAI